MSVEDDKLKKPKSLIKKYFFEERPPMIDDTMVNYCKLCGKGAWCIDDIQHKKKCEVGQALKAMEN